MSNYHFKDKTLSLKAKGLLSQMLSLPEDWDYTIAGLVAINKEKESAIKSTLKELKKQGYLEIIKLMPNQTESGLIEYIYNIHEQPIKKNQGVENQGVENQPLENQEVENHTQLNTNILNTNILNTNNNNIYAPIQKKAVETRHKYGEYKNVLLTDTDLEKLKTEFASDWQQRIEKLSIYKASTGKSYKNDLATIRNWARRDKEEKQQPVKKAVCEFVKGDLPF